MEKDTVMAHLSLHELINACSNGKKSTDEMFNDISLINRETVHDVFKYRKFNEDFVDTITLYYDENEELGKFRPCYYDFTSKLVRYLDCHYMYDDPELTRLLNEKIEELSNITKEGILRDKFPLIFTDLLNGRSYMEEINKLDKNSDEYKEKKEYYYRCGMRDRLDNFLSTQKEIYKRFVNDRYDYGRKTLEVDFNDYIKEYFNMDKVTLFVLDKFLTTCEGSNSISLISRFENIFKNYLNKDTHPGVYVYDKNGREIASGTIEYRIIMVLNKLYNLRNIVDDRDLVKEGSSHTIKKKEKFVPRQIKLTEKELESLKRIGQEKRIFYKEHTPFGTVFGNITIKGYDRARVYANGEIILDAEFKGKGKGAAIYNFKIDAYDDVIGLEAYDLKHDPRVTWIPHRKGWEKKIEEIINREATQETTKEVEKFLKVHNKRRS